MPTEEWFLGGQLIMAAAAAAIFTLALRELRRTEFWLAWLVVLSLTAVLAADVLWMLISTYSLIGIHLQIKNGKPQRASLLLASITAVYCSALWLIKASTLPLVVVWLGSAMLLLGLSNRRRIALLIPLLFAGFSILLWLIAKQSLINLGSYISRSILVIADYGSAMSGMPRYPWIDYAGVAIFGGCSFIALATWWRVRRCLNDVIVLGALAAVFLLGWRMGYTRADGHTMVFFATVIVLIPPLTALHDKVKITLALGLILVWGASFGMLLCFATAFNTANLSAVIFSPYHHVRGAFVVLSDLPKFISRRDAEVAQFREKFPLSKMHEAVGDRPVDMLGYGQTLIVANNFAFAPRPVFQSYAAYSPELARINVAQLRARPFPAFMIVGDGPTDGHLWSMEDPLVFREVLQNYKPLLGDSNYVLMQRRQAVSSENEAPRSQDYLTAKLGDWIELDTIKPVILYVDAHPSFLGKIFSSLLREPGLYLEVETKDKSVNRYRVLRVAARAGFVLSPLIDAPNALLVANSGSNSHNEVRRFRFVPMSDTVASLYESNYRYAIASFSLPKPDEEERRLAQSLAYPGIESPVAGVEGNVQAVVEQDVPVTFAHAPSAIYISLPVGRYRLNGEGGLQSSAISLPVCASSDGVEFRAGTNGEDDVSLLRIDPVHQPSQRGFQPFTSHDFELREPGKLRIHIEPGENTVCDWSYFKKVHLERLSLPPTGSANQG